MNKILTISIAAYNVSKFIDNTLTSFISSSNDIMQALEVIVVNDGSKDDTLKLALKYQERYPDTFIIVDKENGGYGSTINASLKMARGKYFKLVDGDDWVLTSGLENLVRFLMNCDSDLVVTKYCLVSENDGSKTIVDNQMKFDAVERSFDELNVKDALPMHYETIKTSILKDHNISITTNCFYTDIEYILKPIPYINTVVLLDECVYMYRIDQTEQSVSIKSWQKNIDMALRVTMVLVDFYHEIKDSAISKYKKQYIYSRVLQTAIGKYRIFISFKPERVILAKLKKYDLDLYHKDQQIYEDCISNSYVKVLRWSKFVMYRPLASLYRMHLKKTKQI